MGRIPLARQGEEQVSSTAIASMMVLAAVSLAGAFMFGFVEGMKWADERAGR